MLGLLPNTPPLSLQGRYAVTAIDGFTTWLETKARLNTHWSVELAVFMTKMINRFVP
jgi:hypothetical protein